MAKKNNNNNNNNKRRAQRTQNRNKKQKQRQKQRQGQKHQAPEQEIQTQAELAETLARLEAEGIDPSLLEEMRALGELVNPAAHLLPAHPMTAHSTHPHYPPTWIAGQSPWQLLGLPSGELDTEKIHAAWRAEILRHPPESYPELARSAMEARALLLDPRKAVIRASGWLSLPHADALGPAPDASAYAPGMSRLAAQALLYALIDAELSDSEPKQGSLF